MLKTPAASLLICLMAPAPAWACSFAPGTLPVFSTDGSDLVAGVDLKPEEIKIGQPFGFHISVCASNVVDITKLKVDATMPAHKHGMNYEPSLKHLSGNSFRADGLVFHMPGTWEVELRAWQGEQDSRMAFTVDVK